MFSTISAHHLVRIWEKHGRDWCLTFIALSLLSELGEVDRIFTGLRHLRGMMSERDNAYGTRSTYGSGSGRWTMEGLGERIGGCDDNGDNDDLLVGCGDDGGS
jgi:hypothetical protein